MPAVVWPASLPQTPFVGLSEDAIPNTVESEVGSGPPKVRRRSTLERKFQSTPIWLTGTQKATFETFWTNINQGASTFEWSDFITGATAEFRFVRKPKFTNQTPAATITDRIYAATIDLERVN